MYHRRMSILDAFAPAYGSINKSTNYIAFVIVKFIYLYDAIKSKTCNLADPVLKIIILGWLHVLQMCGFWGFFS